MNITSEQDLVALIKKGEERPDLDYKDDINLHDEKKAKAEIAKDVIAMANSGGGVIVAGVKQTPRGFQLAGMSSDSLKAFDSTRLNDFVKNYSDPPINSTTRTVTIDGKIFGVVLIPEFGEQPHIVIRDFPGVLSKGDLLVRTSSNSSEKAGPHELRQLLNRALTRRKGMMQDLLHSVLKANQPVLLEQQTPDAVASVPFDRKKYLETYKGFRILTLTPLGTLSNLRPMDLREKVKAVAIYRESGYTIVPMAQLDIANEKRLPVGIAFEAEYTSAFQAVFFSYFDVAGLVFCAESLWEDEPGVAHPPGSIDILSCCQTILAGLLFARLYYPALGWSGATRVKFSIESSIARSLVRNTTGYMPFFQRFSNEMDIPVTVDGIVDADDDLPHLEVVATKMIGEFCWYFHLDLSENDAKAYLEHLKKKGVMIPKALQPSA